MPGIFLKEKEEQAERLQRGERWGCMVMSVTNTTVREKYLVVMLADGFIRSGLSDTPVMARPGVHDNPSSLPAAFRKVCFAHSFGE